MPAEISEPVSARTTFVVRDCALICRTAGLAPVANLRELRDRLAVCPAASIYHHYCETKLRPSFDDPEYPNDFASWCARALQDRVLAERLSVIDGYDYQDLEKLRSDTLEILDERLAESVSAPWAIQGEQFEFIQAMTVVFDTETVLQSLSDLAAATQNMTLGSIYFHFVEARRRRPLGQDDFTDWIGGWEDKPESLLRDLNAIDVHFLALPELRERIHDAVRRHLQGSATS